RLPRGHSLRKKSSSTQFQKIATAHPFIVSVHLKLLHKLYRHVVRRLYGQSMRCGRLQDLSKIKIEAWQDGIAVNDGWVFNSLGQLSRPVDDHAVIERIEQPAEARAVRDVLFHFHLHIGKAV